MKYGVVFFTRTNTSQRVAEKISNKLSCGLIQITDNINWKGILGYIKAGFYSSINKHVDIQVHGNLDAVDEYVIVAPLWAGGLAPAMKTWLQTIPMDKVHLVVTSLGSLVKDRSGYKSVHTIAKNAGVEDLVIDDLVRSLSNCEA